MKKRIYYILTIILCLTWGAATTYTRAQDLPTYDNNVFIYVSPAGSFDNVGDSWATAKNNLQSAIDVLHERNDVRDGSRRGYVFVAGTEDNGAAENDGDDDTPASLSATYIPNRRSTDDADGSVVNTSFRIYSNIYVIGGFRGDETVPSSTAPEYAYCKNLKELPNMRWLSSGKRYGEMIALHGEGEQGTLDESRSWDLKYKSILSGNHHINNYSFRYDEKRGVYNTTFPLSSYHVVWFGTEGVIDPSKMEQYEPNINKETEDDATPIGGVYYILNAKTATAIVTRPKTGSYSGSINIPATVKSGTVTYKVTEIRNGAFADYTGLTAVTIGNNVTTIGQGAFYGCTGLTSVTFGTGVTHIMRFAFYGCSSLTSVTFPSGIKLIDRWSFANTNLAAETTIPGSINYIGRYAFRGTSIDTNTLPVYEKEETEMTGRYKGLPKKAKLAGFTIEGGYASSTNLIGHDHTGFGGGVYMVRNTEIEDCIIHHCSAVQRGGAVYLDGGGDVNYCYIHTCQATGFGMQQGYGGGVCIDYDGQVEHCYITQCAARAGAGLAICHDPDEYPEETAPMADPTFYDTYKGNEQIEATVYSPFAKASLITNCTSNAEGAGVYLNYGGSLDHLTVVNNECIGPDVIYYGMRHGRTGGIYVREAAAISNTVVWGNKCHVNSDIQFAAFKKEDYYNISVDHSAFSKGDISDWSAVVRKAVINLNDDNYPTAEFNTGNFAMFEHPSSSAGIQHSGGVVNPANTTPGSAYQDAYNWHPLGMSSMRGKGKQIVDVTVASRVELMHANATQDLLGIKFESVSVCGAITNSYHDVTHVLMPSIETTEGERIAGEGDIPTIFVDPNMVAKSDKNGDGVVGYDEDELLGDSWEHPLNNLQDAVFYFSQYLVDPVDASNCTSTDYAGAAKSYYYFGEKDGSGNEIHYPNVQILMKEGSTNVAGRGAYLTGHIRTAAVRPVSKMRLYGGYPKTAAGTDITGRQPYKYKSEVRADVTGGDFNDHSVHVFSLANMHDIIVDGFRMIGGNGNIAKPDPAQMSDKDYAEEMALYNSVANGGGVAMNNANETFPRDMTGNILRNCVIANCAAPEGAGIFVNGNAEHGSKYIDDDPSKGKRKCIAELTVVNTVVRNCTAGDTWDDPDRYVAKEDDTPETMQISLYGIVVANGSGAKIIVRNSDVVNNCGFPFKCTPADIIPTPYTPGSITENTDAGHIEVYNSVIFSNGLRVHADRSGINSTVFCPKESWYNVTGKYLYMGYDVLFPANLVETFEENHIYRILTLTKSEDNTKHQTRVDDGTQQGAWGTTPATEILARFPDFVNPSRNVGHSTTDDKSFYGGAVNYEPLPMNPIVNAANALAGEDKGTGAGSGSADWAKFMGYDIALATRDYGGDPDIGAIETQRLLKGGTVLYVTPDGAGKRDGSSWANAIQGNAIYQISAVDGPGLATGDALDTENGTSRVIISGSDASTAASAVLTTNSKYNGGFGRKYFVGRKTGGTSTTTATTTWKREKNVYTDGPRDGEIEVVDDGTVPHETEITVVDSEGSAGEFTPGFNYDSHFPYGEISGASRSFWRANPYHNGTDWNNASGYSRETFITACNNNGWINNTRSERYVGGLQYAVDSASVINATRYRNDTLAIRTRLEEAGRPESEIQDSTRAYSLKDSVMVWVSNGVYTDYKGFVMRDKTTVMGGFPAKDGGTPGLDERQALMSAVIDIPKSLPAKDLNSVDYETVLQISEDNPINSADSTLNLEVVKYWDDDVTLVETTNTRNHVYKVQEIEHSMTWENVMIPKISNIKYPTLTGMTKSGTEGNWAYGDKSGNIAWYVTHPVKENYQVDISEQTSVMHVFDYDNPTSKIETISSNFKRLRFSNGSQTGLNLFQNVEGLDAGSYELTLDMMGGYRNGGAFDVTTHSNIWLHIQDASGTDLADPVELRCRDFNDPTGTNTSNVRNSAFRKTISFELTSATTVKIMVEVLDGTRNTGSTYPKTPTGSDPDPIPCSYKWDGGSCGSGNNWGTNNPNRREFFIYIRTLNKLDPEHSSYVAAGTTSTEKDTLSSDEPVVTPSVPNYTVNTHRTPIRKRVLTMPDVCVPTYGAGSVGNPAAANNRGQFSDDLSHTHRVFGPSKSKRSSWKDASYVKEDPNYVEYSNVNWDGFTIRHGFIYDEGMGHGGGAGVNMYEGAHLRNCIVIDNIVACPRVKGSGIYSDGATATIEGCFVLDNVSMHGSTSDDKDHNQIFAGGMFLYEGTCFNSLFAKNYSYGSAGGIGFCVGMFFNNTIAHNACSLYEESALNGGAISIATEAQNNLFVANTIIYGNRGRSIRVRDKVSDINLVNPFIDCYIQTDVAFRRDKDIDRLYTRNIIPWTESVTTNYGIGNKLVEVAPSADNTPFAADFDENGVFVAGRAASLNDFRLRSDFPDCINKGTEAFAADLFVALKHKLTGKTDEQIRNEKVYQTVSQIFLPDNDVAYAARVQDCRIDMGAYEFDGTRSIEPTLYPDVKKAIFYVTEEGYGTASASSASDAACAVKFQKVLDAAGRWRYASYKYMASANPLDPTYDATQYYNNFKIGVLQGELDAAYMRELLASDPDLTGSTPDAVLSSYIVKNDLWEDMPFVPEEGKTIADYTEEEIQAAKIAAAKEQLTNVYYTANLPLLKDYEVIVRLEGNDLEDVTPFSYVPSRSVNPNSGSENVLMYSLIVPHGIRVEGGYEDSFETPRDVLGRPTNLDGTVNESGGQAYHVVTFTNDLFTVDEKLFNDGTTDLHDQLEFLGKESTYEGTDAEKAAKKEYNRVVLDGVFLQNGNAAGSEEYYQNGGAAIVTDYAHIRNCVVQDNNASGCGGGLYLDERALVSGCIIKNNTADYGAGIYVFEPSSDAGDATSIKTYAHILSSTIANNTATVSAGGLFFATNVRANSVAIWHNTANANPNVAGTDATGMTQLVENYPMNYCGVESRRMAGVNNIELPAAADQGVRWDGGMWYETSDGQLYFPITMASVLTRTGMPYASYLEMRAKYPTLELTDIFGLNRLAQDLEEYEEGDPPVKKYRPYHLTLADGSTYDKEEKDNAFIEIGARVLNADFQVKLEFKHIMKRLFVTTTERLPTEKAEALQKNTAGKEVKKRYTDKGLPAPAEGTDVYIAIEDTVEMYKQMGSCFLNPMLRLGDALNYVVRLRQATDHPYVVNGNAILKNTGAEVAYSDALDPKTLMSVADICKDVRFEIFVCGGTFYPYKDAYGNQGESRANTFVVPEKVTIVGGVNHETAGHSYCQEGYKEDASFTRKLTLLGDTLYGNTTYEIRTVRDHQDRNGNNVNEPWEMEEQTILSGAAVQNDARANVYHVITCLSNEEQVGQLPTRWSKDDDRTLADTLPALFRGTISPSTPGYTGTLLANLEAETQKSHDARAIIIDGVTITGGYANKIDVSDESMNAQVLTYFRGGGILVEGNWDASFDDDSDLPEVLGVAKRDIPMILTACLIKDNVAGNGGGVYTNGTIYNFGCHYTQNLAIGPVMEEDQKYIPWSAGGAIAANYQCHLWNTLFDNNEARKGTYDIIEGATPMRTVEVPGDEPGQVVSKNIFNPITNANKRQGYGGVVSSSETSLVRACNCDFVRNKAVAFPAIYNFFDNNLRAVTSALTPSDPNYYGRGWHFAVNSIFWGNEATMLESEHVAESTGWEDDYYQGIYGENEDGVVVTDWKEMGTGDERKPYHVANFAPKLDVATLTFCSYQEETGRDGTVWWSNQDKAKSAPLKPKTYPAPIGTLDGLTRLYAGLFTDVLDEYFGYYKDGDSEHPYYVNENPADATSKYIPSALDNESLKYKGNFVYNTQGGTVDYSAISSITDDNERYAEAMSTLNAVAYNYNLVLSKENTETGGPFFVLPSLTAGVDGYMETANWLVSRLNNTIDTGWGFLQQNVTQPDESTGLYDTKLLKSSGKTDEHSEEILVPVGYKLVLDGGNPRKYYERYYTIGDDPAEHYEGEPVYMIIPRGKMLGATDYTTPIDLGTVTVDAETQHWYKHVFNLVPDPTDKGESTYNPYNEECLEEQYHDLFGEGFYNIHSKNIHLRFHDIGYPNLLPIGDDVYMNYKREGGDEVLNMRRISTHPKMGVQDVFIDMGIYEYQYIQLVTSGSETDVIWVGPNEGVTGADGSSCQKATTNLQEAIETLLRSRNDHDKMIKLIGGTYSPQPTVNSTNKAFFIEVPSRTDGVTLPKTLNADETHTVKTLTIRGGYPADITDLDDGEDRRDIEAYPVVFEMQKETGNSEQSLAHLFIIEDAGEKGCYMNYLTKTNKDFRDNVMPIVLDGITFCNPYSENVEEGGAAIYYKPQYRRKETSGNNFEPEMDHLLKAATYMIGEDTFSIPKLIIKNCIVKASGASKNVSAVKIEKGGGQSLIVNSLFHSNSGNPLEAVNTKVVNSTFALNGGHIKLIDETEKYYRPEDYPIEKPNPTAVYPSGLYNSIIWRDDQANGEAKQIERWQDTDLTASETLVEKPTMPMKYNAITGADDPDDKDDKYSPNTDYVVDNALLHKTNKNVFLGPNFADPEGVTPEEGTDAEKLLAKKKSRNFHINPSARFINNANEATYLSIVPFYAEQSLQKQITVKKGETTEDPYIFQSVQRLDRPKTVVVSSSESYTYDPERLSTKNLQGKETVADFPDFEPAAKKEHYPFRRTTATEETWEGSDVTIDRTVRNVQVPYTERELAFKYRYDGVGMELGAYECAASLQRVLYVWENSPETPDGSSWKKAFKRDELQNAIDVASIYSSIKSERAYVFVASDNYLNESVKIRDGVSVFGGLPANYFGEARREDDGSYTDSHINEYINDMNNVRSMTGASVSTIIGLESDENATDPSLGFMLDGFVLRATGLEGTPSSVDKTPFHVDKDLTVLKSCVVTGNNVKGGKPVIQMDHGLLYNSLVYGNTVTSGTPVVQVKTDTKQAGVLNCTVVADHSDEVAISASAEGSVVNTITYNEETKNLSRGESSADAFVSCNTGTENMFAPYFREGANSYDLPEAFTNMRPLWYQLVETSSYINAGQAESTTMASSIFSPYDAFVNYTDIATTTDGDKVNVGLAGDRDPLGNPRLIGTRPDVGCFETWYVNGNYKATNQTEPDKVLNYGGHKYPHRGSVVYVMSGANLVVDTYDDPATTEVTETAPTFTGEGALRPGYVLVKNNGSIYGQGNTLEFSYVAAERNFTGQQYALVGMPFKISYKDASIKAYAYNGETRSTYNYQFLNENSTAWEEITGDIEANEGWLADMGEAIAGTKRFTGWGDDFSTYVYSESGASKTVLLTQYDNRISGTGSSLNFTREEDMGWNLKGLPYLVANYQTNPLGADGTYNMNIPHIFYKDNTTDYLDNSTVETVQSWESTATLSPGYGFFTQTAVIDVESGENLVFKVPTYSGGGPLLAPARPIVLMRDLDNEGDLLTVNPDEGAPKTVNYSLGRDGVKWMMTDAPQLYLLSSSRSRLSLLGAAPTEVDIPLGVSVPEDGRYVDQPRYFTFSLPEPEAFEDYSHVWLIDKALNRVTNLVETNYAAALSAGTDNSRFYLRIGGFPFGNDQRREYIVYAYKRQLFIRGLVEGDQIRVYSLTGQLVLSTIAKDPEFTAELPQAGGIYAVRVNDFSTKVRNL